MGWTVNMDMDEIELSLVNWTGRSYKVDMTKAAICCRLRL